MKRISKRRVMMLSLSAAVGTLGLKFWAFWMTGSVALLSDAAESFVNITAAIIAFVALEIAARPADADHMYGHEKAEYFSSGVEGTLILAAAVAISYEAWERLWNPILLGELPLGLTVAVVAALINFAVSRTLLSASKQHESITLEAHAKHILTDVWTTAGVVGGLVAGMLVHWLWLDSLIAFAVALSIIVSGIRLLRRSLQGLMDYALPPEEMKLIQAILNRHGGQGVTYHQLRARRAGVKRFVDFHMLVPGDRSVQQTHDLCEVIETEMKGALREASITIHVEPLEDPASWEGPPA